MASAPGSRSGNCVSVGNCITEIPVFRPTMEEFSDFARYVEYIESKGAHLAGIAKIIPPPEWKPRRVGYDGEDILNFRIVSPIDQTIVGQQGVYTVFNVTNRKSMRVSKFRELCSSKKYAPPVEDIDDLERKYWRNITLNPPMYGADTPGSFYDDDVDEWNITRLRTILSDVMSQQKIEGVNTPYLYFGMWRSTFAWHTEDMDLYSINYVHHGDPKFWYAIPTDHAQRFERLARTYYPEAAKYCPAYLRHKMCIISPNILRNNSIPVNKMIQRQGEFIITFPKGYHQGFNLGYNIAESTNFAMLRWIDYGKSATLCMCKDDSVRINMDSFVYKFQYDQYEEWKKSRQKQQQKFVLKQGVLGNTFSTDEICKFKPLCQKRSSKMVDDDPDYPSPTKVAKKSVKIDKTSPKFSKVKPLSSVERSIIDNSIKNIFSLFGHQREKLMVSPPPPLLNKKEENFDDPYGFGKWAEPLQSLWQFKPFNMQAEMEFNRDRSLIEPHCSICQYFVPKILAKKIATLNQIPTCSRRILTDKCFRDDFIPRKTPSENCDIDDDFQTSPCKSSDELLSCSRCFITVHRKCYGITKAEIGDDLKRDFWECERCRQTCSTAECKLCRLRGGALRPTDDGKWAHIICTLFAPKRRFNYPFPSNAGLSYSVDGDYLGRFNARRCVMSVESPSKDVKLIGSVPSTSNSNDQTSASSLIDSQRLTCVFCRSNIGRAVPCDFSQSVCENALHPTCGYEAGCSFEVRRDGVTRHVDVLCCDHNSLRKTSNGAGGVVDRLSCSSSSSDNEEQASTSSKTARDAAFFCRPKFAKGDMVWAKRSDGNYFRGCVCNYQIETFCIVDFDDGSFSNNVYLEDLTECDCLGGQCDGAHYSGARVKVHWVSDGKYYGAIFRRAYQTVTYNVRFENGDFDRCTGDELTSQPPREMFEFSPNSKKSKTKAEKKFN